MSLNSNPQVENQAVTILFFYTIPIAAWIFYVMKFTSFSGSWLVFSSGLLLIFSLSLIMMVWVRKNTLVLAADTVQTIQEESSADLPQEDVSQLEALNLHLSNSLQENEELKKSHESLKEQFAALANESSQTIEDLRTSLDQKQQQNILLENQIHDLRYEIKTLLHLTEIDYSSKSSSNTRSENMSSGFEENLFLFDEHLVSSEAEAKLLLKQCIEAAQKITGVCQLQTTKRQKAISMDPFTLDLRLLFDSLRDEQGALISVVSLRDNKLIFANNQTKPLLGYSPEKFVQDFFSIIEEPIVWNQAIENLATRSEVAIKLHMQSKNSDALLTSCHLGAIPTGIFRGLAIAVTYLV